MCSAFGTVVGKGNSGWNLCYLGLEVCLHEHILSHVVTVLMMGLGVEGL